MQHFKKKLVAISGALLLSVSLAPVVLAQTQGDSTSNKDQSAQTKASGEAKKAKLAQEAKDRQEKAKAKVKEAKLKVCAQRQKSISTIMERLGKKDQERLNLYTATFEKADKFYKDSGKTLSNYSTLTADIAAKKAAAQTAVDQVKSEQASFKCTGEPTIAGSSFKAKKKAAHEALVAYRKSVKTFVSAVKDVIAKSSDNTTTGGN